MDAQDGNSSPRERVIKSKHPPSPLHNLYLDDRNVWTARVGITTTLCTVAEKDMVNLRLTTLNFLPFFVGWGPSVTLSVCRHRVYYPNAGVMVFKSWCHYPGVAWACRRRGCILINPKKINKMLKQINGPEWRFTLPFQLIVPSHITRTYENRPNWRFQVKNNNWALHTNFVNNLPTFFVSAHTWTSVPVNWTLYIISV